MLRAVIYSRFSSDMQRDASIDDQQRICRERIAREGWSLVETYADRAMSGSSRFRPDYQRMLVDARRGAFDVLLAEALDRLSRDQEDVASLYKRLGFAGVRIVTIAEGDISDLHVGLKGTMNALFIKDLAAKTHRGLRGRVAEGSSAGGLCYGYSVVLEHDGRGEPIRGKRRIDEGAAAIVRRVFTEYAEGRSPRSIAQKLNFDGVPGPTGTAWGPSTINGNAARGTGILNNELYVGRMVWNRLKYVKDPETGRRISRLNPKSAWVTQNVPELRIVTDELWESAQQRRKANQRATRPDRGPEKPFWDQRRARYLFSGLVKCGACGGGFVVISRTLYGCANARNKGTCTNRLNMRRDVLEASVLNGLRSHLLAPELFAVFADEFYKELNRLRSAEANKRDELSAEIAGVEKRLRKIVDAISEGVAARSLKDELLSLEARQDELRRAIADCAEPKPLVHPALADIYRRKVAELSTALTDRETQAEAAEMIRSLVDEIRLVPEGDHLRIDLRGELAGILALAADSKKPAALDDGLEQIKVVAGTRNQRYLHPARARIPKISPLPRCSLRAVGRGVCFRVRS